MFVVNEASEDVAIGNCLFQLNSPAKQDICVAMLQKFYTQASVNTVKLTGILGFPQKLLSANHVIIANLLI